MTNIRLYIFFIALKTNAAGKMGKLDPNLGTSRNIYKGQSLVYVKIP